MVTVFTVPLLFVLKLSMMTSTLIFERLLQSMFKTTNSVSLTLVTLRGY